MREQATSDAATADRDGVRVAVLIPCYNEAPTIADVVADFRDHLPHAVVYVYDNNSTDATAAAALEAGAVVRREDRQGKGEVVRRMFADVEADVYVLVDGDGTYDASAAPAMIERLCADRLDMVVNRRVAESEAAYRSGHAFGNRMLTRTLSALFGHVFTDILSGYRVFSRRFVKSFPAHAVGFETETELSVHALELRMPVAEVDAPYFARPEGSDSKLGTYRDGWRILSTIVRLYETERPRRFFWALGAVLFLTAIVLAVPILIEFARTGLVPRFPTAILATGLSILAGVAFVTGILLDAVTRGRREQRRFAYLAQPPPPAHLPAPSRAGVGVRRP